MRTLKYSTTSLLVVTLDAVHLVSLLPRAGIRLRDLGKCHYISLSRSEGRLTVFSSPNFPLLLELLLGL
jgi:hypothetical protein